MKQSKDFPVIGITGGAGSGKSTIVELIKRLVPTEYLHCDVIAHELMEPGGTSYEALVREYGTEILEEVPDGPIAREKLSEIAMATPESRARLNELTHPLVRREVEQRLEALRKEGFHGVAVMEAALLLEAGFSDLCDEVWYVYAPLTDRIRRMKENRGYSEEKIERILAGQLSEDEFKAQTDFVILNPDAAGETFREETECRIKERLETRFHL